MRNILICVILIVSFLIKHCTIWANFKENSVFGAGFPSVEDINKSSCIGLDPYLTHSYILIMVNLSVD